MKTILNPVPGTTKEKNSRPYAVDSGIDIHVPEGTKVVAAAAGWILYAEYGHTSWVSPPDTPYSVLIELEEPLTRNGRVYRYLWYTHLKKLLFNKADDGQRGRKLEAGDVIGVSGTGNRVPHLHFGVLVNRSQASAADWMDPFELEKLIYDKSGEQNKPEIEYGVIKLFHNDKGTTVVIDGKSYPVVSIGPDGLKYKK